MEFTSLISLIIEFRLHLNRRSLNNELFRILPTVFRMLRFGSDGEF